MNILWITIEDLGYDVLDKFAYGNIKPYIFKTFFKQSVVFHNYRVMTSDNALNLKQTMLGENWWTQDESDEQFKEMGKQPLKEVILPNLGVMNELLESYECYFNLFEGDDKYWYSAEKTAQAIDKLNTKDNYFFAWHHVPSLIRKNIKTFTQVQIRNQINRMMSGYLEEEIDYVVGVLEAQEQVRSLVDKLDESKLLDDTIMIISGSSGKEFSLNTNRFGCYDERLHTPLIIFHPDFTPKDVLNSVTSSQLMPTIFKLAGIETEGLFAEKDFVKLCTEDIHNRSDVYSMLEYNKDGATAMGLRGPMFQYYCDVDKDMVVKNQELYDLNNDGFLNNNLFPKLDTVQKRIVELANVYRGRLLERETEHRNRKGNNPSYEASPTDRPT